MQFIHHPDRAVVRLAGELSVDAVEELVDTVDMLRRVYFYSLIEIRIGSRGGTSAALGAYCDALARWRDAGVRVRTRAVTVAESAAAIVLSLGDERIAEPRAQVLYHNFRVVEPGSLTADGSASVCARLSRLDEHYLARLVERAFDGGNPSESRRGAIDDSDLPVLERLTRLFPCAAEARAGGVARLACVLERFIQSSIRDRDPNPIALLYAELFDSELSVSPAVAHLLRLIDHVGDPAPAPAQIPAGALGLTVPEWARLYPPGGDVPREVLTRHTLVFGATGAGKTASVVLPILQAALRAPRGRFSGGLVLDPKRELAVLVEREAPGRLHLLNPSEAGVDLMAGEADALAQLLREWRYREVAQRILLRALSFERHLPTRVLLDHQAPQYTTNSEFWDREGTALLTTVVAFVLMLIDPRTAAPETWCGEAEPEPESRWVCALRARARGGAGERGDNVLALAAWVFDSAFVVRPVRDGSDSPFGDMPDWRFGRVARAARSLWVAKGEATDIVRQILEYWMPLTETSAQFRTIVASARAACGAAAEPALARTVYFGCEPGASSAYETGDAIGRAAGTDPDGPVLVYQPCDAASDVFLAKVIKALFFERASAHPERVRGGAELPLACYVADEAHRYVTSAQGEESFIDRARSLSVFCVLATPSIASLVHRLASLGGGEVQDRAAVALILANSATKLFLNSTEFRVADLAENLSPALPGFASPTQIRPLSSLAVGECYAALADGRFERRQLEPVLLARDGADRHVGSRVLALPAPPASRVASGSES